MCCVLCVVLCVYCVYVCIVCCVFAETQQEYLGILIPLTPYCVTNVV